MPGMALMQPHIASLEHCQLGGPAALPRQAPTWRQTLHTMVMALALSASWLLPPVQ